jgi:hypothetical protein
LVRVFGKLEPHIFQDTCHAFGVSFVHLTAEGGDVVTTRTRGHKVLFFANERAFWVNGSLALNRIWAMRAPGKAMTRMQT